MNGLGERERGAALSPNTGYPRFINNWLHDVATGTWAACVLVIWLLSGRLAGIPAEAAAALADSMRWLFYLALGALAVITVTGGVRLGYWRREADPAELSKKRRALIVKHVAFLLVYGAGTVWLWILVRAAA